MRSYLLTLAVVLVPAAVRAQDAPLPPEKAAEHMKLPEGFRARLVAAEPTLVKPIAMNIDDRGRLWVVESHCYPNWIKDGKEGTDRVLIFEDREGKGKYDCTVFWDRGTNLSGVAVGFGGVWLCATPNLIFIPVKPGEDKPAGPPQVVLDGWSLQTKHNVFNGLIWGPDGWLWGLNGIQAGAKVGAPGTPDKDRVALNCGVWRYHPTKKKFEVVAWGTTNPWGLDFDDYGEAFITNCVIKHLFHVVPGAHFKRMYGEDLNPYTYGLIESCADHIHWAGGNWTDSRGGVGAHNETGGGHAHAGAMVYLGDNWPDEYRNRVFMCNIHGNRVNQDILERKGSGYVAKHGKDFLLAGDPWFRGLSLLTGPDGSVFISDWCDTGECHNYDKVAPRGRIYRVSYGDPKPVKVDLAKLSDEELVKLQTHKNDWWVRHSRRLLQERAAAGKLSDKVVPALREMLDNEKGVTRKLRALWALNAVGGLDEKTLLALLGSKDERLQGWAIRLLVEEPQPSEAVVARLTELARGEAVAPVRLALASALQRLPAGRRWPIAEALAAHTDDWNDLNLPLMIWYGIEAAVPEDAQRAGVLLGKAKIPLVRQNTARRLAETDKGLSLLVQLLGPSDDINFQLDILRGTHEALRGRRDMKAPGGWFAIYRSKLAASTNPEVRQKALFLTVLFGDLEALAPLRKTAADPDAKETDRREALQTLLDVKAPGLLPLLNDLVADKKMAGPALRGLAGFNDPKTPEVILRHYAALADADKADAVNTLASRPAYALALLDAVEKGKVPRRDISAFTARQMLNFKNKELTDKLTAVWGTIRPAAQDKKELLNKYKAIVPPDALAKADRSRGRALFAKTCAACHTLFDAGGKIGPDLTGSQRTNPEYLLTKLLDPNAVVAQDFQVSLIETVNGRVVTGIVTKEDGKTVTVQTQNELLTLAKADIQERKKTGQSLMPERQLEALSEAEVRDLFAYLTGQGQVPLPAGKP